MTDQGPRSLLPGGALRQGVPYGMTPGVRSVLPGINDMSATAWNKPPEPEQIDLDAPIPNPPPPGPQAPDAGPPSEPVGYELTMPDGSVARFTSGAHKKRDADQVQALGNALLNHATSDAEKSIAQQAIEWGMAQVGQTDIGEIRKQMTHFWDQGTGGILKTSLQTMKSKANRGGVGGVPNGPSKADKFDNANDQFDANFTEKVLGNAETTNKVAALNDYESDMNKLDTMISAPDALSQRASIMEYMKTLSGKQSTDMERQQIAGAAGLLDSIANKLSLLSPTDASLTKAYIAQFKANIATIRASIKRRKAQIGDEVANRLVNHPHFLNRSPEEKKRLRAYGRGAITGEYPDDSAPAPTGGAPVDPLEGL